MKMFSDNETSEQWFAEQRWEGTPTAHIVVARMCKQTVHIICPIGAEKRIVGNALAYA